MTVDSTEGMAAGDIVIFSVENSNDTDDSSDQYTIGSVNSGTQFTVSHKNGVAVSLIWNAGPPPSLPQPDWAVDNSWVDVLGTGNLNFRNSNVKHSGSASLQFDYSDGSLGYNGGRLKFRSYKRRTPLTDPVTPAATDRLEVDRDGKMTVNPSGDSTGDFCVESSALGTNLLHCDVDTPADGGTVTVNGDLKVIATADVAADSIDDGDNLLEVNANTARVMLGGKVGINTASPRHSLDIRGSFGTGAATGTLFNSTDSADDIATDDYTVTSTDFFLFANMGWDGGGAKPTPSVILPTWSGNRGRVIWLFSVSGNTTYNKDIDFAVTGGSGDTLISNDDLSEHGYMMAIATNVSGTWLIYNSGRG